MGGGREGPIRDRDGLFIEKSVFAGIRTRYLFFTPREKLVCITAGLNHQVITTKIRLFRGGVPFFATLCRRNHDSNLDLYRVLHDAKGKEKENDDS